MVGEVREGSAHRASTKAEGERGYPFIRALPNYSLYDPSAVLSRAVKRSPLTSLRDGDQSLSRDPGRRAETGFSLAKKDLDGVIEICLRPVQQFMDLDQITNDSGSEMRPKHFLPRPSGFDPCAFPHGPWEGPFGEVEDGRGPGSGLDHSPNLEHRKAPHKGGDRPVETAVAGFALHSDRTSQGQGRGRSHVPEGFPDKFSILPGSIVNEPFAVRLKGQEKGQEGRGDERGLIEEIMGFGDLTLRGQELVPVPDVIHLIAPFDEPGMGAAVHGLHQVWKIMVLVRKEQAEADLGDEFRGRLRGPDFQGCQAVVVPVPPPENSGG